MCGIAGVFDSDDGARVRAEDLSRMIRAIGHRGPDAHGASVTPAVGLSFARLTIIDEENGMQPMTTEDGMVISVCNGEILNYDELRCELVTRGYRFRSRCDSELVPYLYREYGEGCFNRLEGQFAIALFDQNARRLYLGRDPFGICPLFYATINGQLLFASEIKAILQFPGVEKTVDLIGLDASFTFPGLVSPRTMFRGIASLPPGHFLRMDASSEPRVQKYWELELGIDDTDYADVEERVEELDGLLGDSVRRCLRSDVPVGVYLSGGLDSSLVAAQMKKLYGHDALKSFAIDFADPLLSEGKYQRFMARYLDTDHHQRVLDAADIAARLKAVVYHAESPLNDTFNVATLCLSELAREKECRVVLAGEGADELFGGYVGYRFDHYGHDRSQASADEAQIRSRLWGDEKFFYERDYTRLGEVKRALYSTRLRDCYPAIDSTRQSVIDTDVIRGADPLRRRSYIDCKLRLSSHLLADHGDRMAMANAVEVRYPFLDLKIAAFAARLPASMKVQQGVEKFVLKRLGARYLPQPIVEREKFAFSAPGSPALLKQNDEYMADLLSPATIRRQGFFDPAEIQRLKARYSAPGFRLNVPFQPDLLIVVASFGMFLEIFDMPGM